ncbi:hypothetical protein DFH09DRAFT_935071, partial [Mycena vulgaris]
LWFLSDSLVIRAEQKNFRVTKSILAARSSVFRDMLASPQPASEETDIIDGSPVVSLSIPPPKSFMQLTCAESYLMLPPTPVENDAVLGVLRLAHKYDVQYLYLRALDHLKTIYDPSSLDEYRTQPRDPIIYPASMLPSYLAVIGSSTEVGRCGSSLLRTTVLLVMGNDSSISPLHRKGRCRSSRLVFPRRAISSGNRQAAEFPLGAILWGRMCIP